MNQSILSIIVPVYNVAPYLETCVQSLIAQTYPNIEILLIDDGSTDGSSNLCDLLAQAHRQIRVIHQSNSGVSAARNAGLRIARGQYIGFVDSDDWVEPEMYATMIRMMEADGTDAAFCGYWEDMEQDGSFLGCVPHAPQKTGKVSREEAVYQCLIGSDAGYYIINCNKCFRREMVYPNGTLIPFPEKIPLSEDEFWLSQVIQNLGGASLTSQMFYHWRIRGDSASHVLQCGDSIRHVFRTQQKAAEQFAKIPSCADLAMARVYDNMFRYVWVAYFTEDKESECYFREQLKPYRKIFLKSREFSAKRKIKFLLVDWMCRLQLSSHWISRIEQASSAK